VKSKVFTKKLALSKKNIADLNNKDMKDVVGGEPETRVCPTYSYWPIVCKDCSF
jgi:hypothetical protein